MIREFQKVYIVDEFADSVDELELSHWCVVAYFANKRPTLDFPHTNYSAHVGVLNEESHDLFEILAVDYICICGNKMRLYAHFENGLEHYLELDLRNILDIDRRDSTDLSSSLLRVGRNCTVVANVESFLVHRISMRVKYLGDWNDLKREYTSHIRIGRIELLFMQPLWEQLLVALKDHPAVKGFIIKEVL